ncbi:GNAT family N-acetyltransferase [Longispora albida]|uniref:GNAT family N-acetyltransferase n=1 Tax=Longispora albida TaxID=203523 RepID=UPI00036CF99C|nr:GNAT family N-acetyltransferase [Longispora albida]
MISPTARELAEYFLAAQHPRTLPWAAEDTRLDLLTEQREVDVLLAADLSIAATRAGHFAPGQPPEALLNQWAAVEGDDSPDGLHAMLSMRYEGLDPSKPFVDATVLSRPFTAADLPALAEAAVRAYGALQPRYLRLWSAEPAGHFAGTGPDKRFLAAPVADLRAGGPMPAELGIARATSVEHYAEASAAYAALAAQHPDHPGQATIQDLEDLEENLAEGHLFDVTAGGQWAGYLAVSTEGESLGLPAYVVQELMLATRFRGRGYGQHLTTLLARALPEPERVLLGTIHASNRGARHAAERSGRVDVGGWVQVPLR